MTISLLSSDIRLPYDQVREIARQAAQEALNQAFPAVGHEHFRLPNNLWGRLVRRLIMRYLNRKVYEVRAYGRGPRFPGARRWAGTPMKDSKVFVLYIQAKVPVWRSR